MNHNLLRTLLVICPLVVVAALLVLSTYTTAADQKPAAAERPEGKPAVKTLVKPKNWPAGASAADRGLELRCLPSDGRA